MKALTVQQPWASAILVAGKDVENRSWRTLHRGPLLIHAGSGRLRAFDAWDWMDSRDLSSDLLRASACVRGAILGIVDLVDCVRDHSSPWALSGYWHWVLASPRIFESPIPIPGRLSLWNFPASQIPETHGLVHSAGEAGQRITH